jgi:hypothetical protein
LLRAEGFTDIRYVDATEAHIRRAEAANSSVIPDMIAHGEVDFGRAFAPSLVLGMNAGAPITILSGLHLGCFEIFGKKEMRQRLGVPGSGQFWRLDLTRARSLRAPAPRSWRRKFGRGQDPPAAESEAL